MTLVSLIQAAHDLGIDVKTLRRWLLEAQLPLHPDPDDARKKGVSLEHLELLATQHQRRFMSVPPDLPTSLAISPVAVPTELVALPQTLEALQTQITALQQQIATLTQLLQLPPAPPVAPPPSSKKTHRQTAKAILTIPPGSKTSSMVKVPRKPAHVIPRVEYGKQGHCVVIWFGHSLERERL